MSDHTARESIRTALDATLIVEAAAGTGKTTELVQRIVNVLAEGRTTVDRIVAVTFTEKAAGELKLRLRERLERARHERVTPEAEPSESAFVNTRGAHRSALAGPHPHKLPPRDSALGGGSGLSPRAAAPRLADSSFKAFGAPPPNADAQRLRASHQLTAAVAAAAGARTSHVERALEHLEEAYVSTIHGFCAELLRERPVEAKIDPRFEVLTEVAARRLYGQVFDLWMQEQLDRPPEGIRRGLRRTTRGSRDDQATDREGPTGRLRRAGWMLCEWRDFSASWKRPPFDRRRVVDEVVAHVLDFADQTARAKNKEQDGLYRSTWHARSVSEAIRASERARARDYDAVEAALVDLAANYDFKPGRIRKGFGTQYGEGLPRADVLRQHEALVDALERFRDLADADLAALLQTELVESIHRYQQIKADIGRLDFVDLLVRARDLVRDHPDARAAFQQKFTHIYVDEFQDTDPLQAEILLLLSADDPAVNDWQLVHPAPGKLFMVGDPKQSIYRFRRADVAIYEDVKTRLAARGARVVHLTTSFRSVPSLQRFVNSAFQPIMTGHRELLQPAYVRLDPSRPDFPDQPTIVALPVPRPYGTRNVTNAAIEASLPDAVGAFVEWLVHASGWTVTERASPEPGTANPNGEPRTANGEPGTRNSEPGTDMRVPLLARHICILFRRFDSWGQDATRPYVDALEARNIPHLLVGGKSFHAREEVETMRAALAAIEWPDDELSVYATLRGSLFGISDEQLFEYRSRLGRLHPFRTPEEADAERHGAILGALALLKDLHRSRNDIPVAETIGRLLASTRAHAGFVLRPSGEQALANVLHIAELARQYEAAGGISFRAFVDQLEEEADAGEASEAPIVEEGSEGVRMMTVHRAKGLEFPVVVLADLTARLARQTASRHVDLGRKLCATRLSGWAPLDLLEQQPREVARDEAEGIRLAYVAATRARDLLVIPALGDGSREDGWLDPLSRAIHPPVDRRQSSEPARGCPAFGRDTVLARPEDVAMTATPVAPGLHWFTAAIESPPAANVIPFPTPPASKGMSGPEPPDPSPQSPAPGYAVVWWDPRTLSLDVEPRLGVRQEQLIGKDAPREVIDADLAAYHRWRTWRDEAVTRGGRSSLLIETVTARAGRSGRDRTPALRQEGVGADGDADVEVVEVSSSRTRPSGIRYGSLVHAVLATVPLDAVGRGVDEIATLQGRILGASDEEVASAASVVIDVLTHPLFDRARAADARGACRRETPVTLTEPDGILVEGVVDLAFEEDGRWTIVDFKTDYELDGALDVYRRQVQIYARVVSEATGQPARAILMRV